MTVKIEREIHRNYITWLLCSWEVFYYSHWFYSGVETVLLTVSSVIVREGVIWWHILGWLKFNWFDYFGLLIHCLVCKMSENAPTWPAGLLQVCLLCLTNSPKFQKILFLMFENLQLENLGHFCLEKILNWYVSVMVWVSCYNHYRHLSPQVSRRDFPLPVFVLFLFFFCVHLCFIWSGALFFVSVCVFVSTHVSCLSCLSCVCYQPFLCFQFFFGLFGWFGSVSFLCFRT